MIKADTLFLSSDRVHVGFGKVITVQANLGSGRPCDSGVREYCFRQEQGSMLNSQHMFQTHDSRLKQRTGFLMRMSGKNFRSRIGRSELYGADDR